MQLDEHEQRHMRNSEITTRVANNDVHVTKSSFALSSAARNHLRAVDERFQVSRFSSSYVINKFSEGIDDLSFRQLKSLAHVLYFVFTVSWI